MRLIFLCGLVLFARVAGAAEPVRYLSVVNDSGSDVQSVEISAPHASFDGTLTERHVALRGGDTETWGIQVDGQCMRDLLVTFSGDQRVIVRDLDICKDRVVHTRELYAAVLRDRNTRFNAANVASTLSTTHVDGH